MMDTLHLSVGFTLVDLTPTNIVSHDSVERNQQRNWETVIQVLGLRTQLMFLKPPVIVEKDVTNMQFGKAYTGVHKVWEFKFGIEFEAVYANEISQYGTLENDFVNVPIVTGLLESANIIIPAFIVSGEYKNIFFEQLAI